jgi:hypothetical protein
LEVKLVPEAFCLRIKPSYKNYYQKLGKLGKKNQKKILANLFAWNSLRICCALGAALASGCHHEISDRLQAGQVLAWHGLQGRWVGEVTPADTTCGPATQGLMTIGPKGFAFDPFQGTTVLSGDVAEDGRLTGKLVRTGPDHRDLSIAFDGMTTGDRAIEGTLQSGRCRWKVTLHRG